MAGILYGAGYTSSDPLVNTTRLNPVFRGPHVYAYEWQILDGTPGEVLEEGIKDRYHAHRRAAWLKREVITTRDAFSRHSPMMDLAEDDMAVKILVQNHIPLSNTNDADHKLWISVWGAKPGEYWGTKLASFYDLSPYLFDQAMAMLALGLDRKPAMIIYECHATRTLHEYGTNVGSEGKYTEHRLLELHPGDTNMGHTIEMRMRCLQRLLAPTQYLGWTGGRP